MRPRAAVALLVSAATALFTAVTAAATPSGGPPPTAGSKAVAGFDSPARQPLDPQAFRKPDSRFGILAEWLWDACVDDAGIDRGLRQFASRGITEIVIARWDGLVSGTQPEQQTCAPYLSDAFFAEVGHALETARRLSEHIWIYDGDAAGDDTGAQQAALQGHPELAGEVITERAEGASYPVSTTGMDKFNPKAAERLIAVEFQPFLERFRQYAPAGGGDTLRGFWKDEPQIAGGTSQNGHPTGSTLPWSETFPAWFRKLHGYDVSAPAVLQSILHGSAPIDRKHRIDYWSAISEKYARDYFGVQQGWCHKYGLDLLVQPRWDDADFRNEMNGQGSYFAMQRYADVPGADLWSGSRGDDNFKNATEGMNFYEVASAAHLFGRTRAQQEPYGVTQGTGLELAQQKALGDRMYARGLNVVSPAVTHYAFNSSQAIFAGDYGPMNTAWPYFDLLNAHFARMGQVLAGAAHVARTALLYPMSSVWAMDPDVSTDASPFQYAYLNAGGALQVSWRGVEVMPEDLLTDAATTIRDGHLLRHGLDMTTVVLPAVTTLSRQAVRALQRLVDEGGSVIALSRLPTQSTDGNDAALQRAVRNLFGVNPVTAQADHIHTTATNGRAVFVAHDYTTGNATTPAALQPLLSALNKTTPRDAILRQPVLMNGLPANEIYHARERNADVYFVTNYPSNALQGAPLVFGAPSATSTTGVISLPATGTPELWNPDDGSVRQAPVWWREGGRTIVPLDLPEYGAEMIVVRHTASSQPHVVRTDVPVLGINAVGDLVTVRVAPAKTGVYHLTVQRGSQLRSMTVHLRAATTAAIAGPFAVHYTSWPGLPVPSTSPADDSQSYGNLALAHPDFSGSATYSGKISIGGQDEALSLGQVLNYATVAVDGRAIGRRAWPPYDVPVSVAPGTHTLSISVMNTTSNTVPGADFDPAKAFGLLGPVTLSPLWPATVTVEMADG
jgi:hypothetical protein